MACNSSQIAGGAIAIAVNRSAREGECIGKQHPHLRQILGRCGALPFILDELAAQFEPREIGAVIMRDGRQHPCAFGQQVAQAFAQLRKASPSSRISGPPERNWSSRSANQRAPDRSLDRSSRGQPENDQHIDGGNGEKQQQIIDDLGDRRDHHLLTVTA
jgi:hypothetical protein